MVRPDTFQRFVDDASPLGASLERRASPVRGDRVVNDEDLPRLGRYAGDVRLRVTGGAGQALDAIAEAEWVAALPLEAFDPVGAGGGDEGAPGAGLAAWIDAAMDRETAVSFVGGSVEQALAGLTTAARLWGDETDLARARRWVRSWATEDPDAALDHLQGLA